MPLPRLNSFTLNLCGRVEANKSGHYFRAVRTYKFRADKTNRYLAVVEEYYHHVYVLKFCLEKHQNDQHKFNALAGIGYGKAKRVMLTCARIGQLIYEENPYASFGFIASPTLPELNKNGFNNTKRLTLFHRVAKLFFSAEEFTHRIFYEQSVYFLLNKKYEQEEPAALQKITTMLRKDMLAAVKQDV